MTDDAGRFGEVPGPLLPHRSGEVPAKRGIGHPVHFPLYRRDSAIAVGKQEDDHPVPFGSTPPEEGNKGGHPICRAQAPKDGEPSSPFPSLGGVAAKQTGWSSPFPRNWNRLPHRNV